MTTTVKTTTPRRKLRHRLLVKLDHRTTILLRDQSLFKVWKKKYPEARIIQFYQN